ncbi:MAG: histidinol dehydrogenase, partial [Spirochaetes bacterium]
MGEFAEREGLSVWAKLDSGGQALYSAMNRSSLAFEEVLEGLRIFSRLVPVTIQTMVCSLNGRAPSSQDAIDLAVALSGLLDSGCRIHGLQVYTLARPPLEAWAGGISDADIKEYIGIVASVLGGRLPVQGYGASGLGPLT